MSDPLGPEAYAQQVLSGTALFGALDPDALASVMGELEPKSLEGGQVLFRQGDPGDALYVVLSGRLRVERTDRGRERVVREVGRGESVGELALLTGAPRTASARAVRDAELLRLSRERFEALVRAHPLVAMALTRMLAGWLATPAGAAGTAAGVSTVALLAATADAPVSRVARSLAAALAAVRPTARLDVSALDARLWPGAAHSTRDEVRYPELARWLDEQERLHAFVVYEADQPDTEWARRAVRHADVVLYVARADRARLPPGAPAGGQSREWASRELVLVHDDDTRTPTLTEHWLTGRDVARHHHLRLGRIEDMARLARRLTGRAVGVALSGGGARGFAHIGVLRAMEEAGIPVDEIGGTSMGAIIAAQYAAGYSIDEMVALNRECWLKFKPHRAYTLPYMSLVTERQGERMLRRMFGGACLEDCWLECFSCATNLTRAELVVHRRGPVVPALLSSSAIPGVAPPMVAEHGELLVDGGVLDNLPAGHLHGGVDGAVIASDTSPEVDMQADPSYAVTPSAWRVVANRLNPFARRRYFPSIFEVLSRSAVVASARESRRVRDAADVYLHPPVSEFGIFEFERIDELVEVGHAYALERLRTWWRSRTGATVGRRTTQVMV